MGERARPWKKVWPPFVPKSLQVTRSLGEYFRQTALSNEAGIALDFYGCEITYGQLDESIDRFAHGLLQLGLKQGDRVAIHMQNCPQFVISYMGTLRAGGVVVCINPMFKHSEIEYELNDAQAEIYAGLDYLYPEVEKIRAGTGLRQVILTALSDYLTPKPAIEPPAEAKKARQVFPETLDFADILETSSAEPVREALDIHNDLALLQYTGGTTGLPKGAMITHHALALAALGAKYWFDNSRNDVYLGVTPFFHIMGMVQMMCTPLLSGGKLVILSRFEAETVAKAITHYRCTGWVGATTMLIALLQLPDIKNYDMSSFRYICTGGATIGVELQEQIRNLLPHAMLMEGYGLTESVSQGGVTTPLGRYKPGFVGTPYLNDLKIVNPENGESELPPHEEGEIVIKGPALTTGYWNRPEETDKVFRDGWFYTGDVGLFDEEGYLKYSGRMKELIKCSGFSVFPAEVEDLMYRHPAVAEVAVTGVPDPYRGESPKAYVVLKQEYKDMIGEKDLMEWSKENMAAYKRPREFEFRESLPKSGAGKILRRLL